MNAGHFKKIIGKRVVTFVLAAFFINAQAQHEGHNMPAKKPEPKKETASPKKQAPAKTPVKKKTTKQVAPKASETPAKKDTLITTPVEPNSKVHDVHDHTEKHEPQKKPVSKYLGKKVFYNLSIHDTTVNYTGRKRPAMAINGQIPAPTLYFTQGDTAVITVHNHLHHEASIHWHGVLLPNDQDGVPLLNTKPIKAGETHTFQFPIIQNGTLWYHSHSHVQEQAGLYGSLVFYPPPIEGEKQQKEQVLLISDWRDEKPGSIMRSLKRRNEWYSIKKKAVQSWGEALVKGSLSDKIQMEWWRMPGADLSDVYYNRFLMHGQPLRNFENYKKGDTIRLRIINGSAASYFWLHYSGGKMKVISADGNDVKPIEVDKLLIATAETYDILIVVPDNGQYELRATAQDITGYASAFFGSGTQVKAKDIPPLDYMVLMKEMNRMTWMMKGMGMTMRMGSKMDMEGMEDLHKMNDLRKLDGTEVPGKKVTIDMSSMDMGMMNMGEMDMQGEMNHGNMPLSDTSGMKGMDHSKHDMKSQKDDTSNLSMQGMDHSKMNMQVKDTMQHSLGLMMVNMMPPIKMTGFTVPPGNGNDVVLSYDMLRSDTSTVLPENRPWREIFLNLTGNMQRFVWSVNGKTLSQQEDMKLLVRKGENVRIIFTNTTMMEHPLHLHGHFFRVVNKQGDYAPMKHTFNINAMDAIAIEFAATEEKDWFIHCHTLYHMVAGMATVLSYAGTESEVQKTYPRQLRKFFNEHGSQLFAWTNASFHSQGTFGTLVLSGRKFQLDQDWKWNWKESYELETKLQRFLDKRQFFSAFAGFEWDQNSREAGKEKYIIDEEKIITAGFVYTLPFLINAEARVDHTGKFRLQLGREDFPLTTRTRLDFYANTEKEFGAEVRYIIGKYMALSANYDSDFGIGGGISIIY